MRPIGRAVLLGLLTCGCDSAASPQSSQRVSRRVPATRPAATSSLIGRVVWSGPAPQVPPIQTLRPGAAGAPQLVVRPAPNAPAVGPDGGVAGAVVFLRGVDPTAVESPGHRWPPVTVELHDERPMIRQGHAPPGHVGFVRRGDAITIVSRQPTFHALRARGAAFWTLTLPDADRPRSRQLDEAGVVELSSGVTYYWMRAYLWVCDHPYYTATAADGRWRMPDVPAGEYDLVAWLPNWQLLRHERDPEAGQIARYVFRPPIEVLRRVVVRDGVIVDVGDVRINP